MESKLLRPLSQAVALALAAGGAHAASITVTDAGDSGTAGTCTLRQAIASSNADDNTGSTCVAGSGADTIRFGSGITSIALTQGQLLIDSNVTISGSGQTITAAPNSRVMQIQGGYGNTVYTVSLTGLILTGGSYGQAGAGLAIGNSQVEAPQAARPGRSGPTAATASASVTLDKVTINNSTSNVRAGGLFIDNASVAIDQSTISGNSLTATGNYGAGGVYITDGSTVSITNSTISGNGVSGNDKFLTGGVYVYRSQLTVINSTITGNSASGTIDLAGGISLANSSAGLYNSTVTGNSTTTANVAAGGILVGNQYVGAGMTIYNSILSGNTGTQADMSIYRSNVLAKFTLMGTALQNTYAGNGNVFSDTPGLGPLANNGGPTQTMLPLPLPMPFPGNLVLGGGNPALIPAGVTTDQRGVGYARVVNGSLDLGSVEAAAAPAAAMPTPALSRWAMLALGGLLGLFGLRRKRQRES